MASLFPSPPPPYTDAADPAAPPSHSDANTSLLTSLLIIAGLLAFVVVACVSIHALLRYLSRSSPSSTLPRTHRGQAHAGAREDNREEGEEKRRRRLIESLPRFTMASALAALPKSSPDCAVCLSPFTPDAELRLLPACRHAFHAACVDAWLRTSPTCPLCRASIALPHPSISAILAAEQPPPPEPRRISRDRFRVEMGSVSSRGSPISVGSGGGDSRTYSLGSFEYHIEEEVEAVVSRMVRAVARAPDTIKEEKPAAARSPSPSPPGEAVAEAAGSPTRSWLREYMDRLASSASSFALPGLWSSRWSQRNEEPWLWDTEAAATPPPPPPGYDEDETAFMVLYRWIAAV
ncbi:E3 ubiquitin-protein ligase ATL4-like [Lolium rigidum]|uniref:E3 ubiquitin-protein ligase ATL4-like n=1 Tax=Lolium rigidum TaxID=89674 RepID=UPI001F5D95EF|nr:E3 ubiquitin-protein ligase ATL4-like [Lolium rigidum]